MIINRWATNFGLICICVLAFSVHSISQIQVFPANLPGYNPKEIISNVFLGDGITITDVTFSGVPQATGVFTNALGEINLGRGIVMSTGNVSTIANPNLEGDTGSGTSGNLLSDAELESIVGGTLADVVKFEISFIPVSDTLQFNYVFASEEYPEFVCDNFNDAFGFFISGPKPGGGQYQAENIALVPDPTDLTSFTDFPVAINSVNPGSIGSSADPASGENCSNSFESLDFSQFYNSNTESNQLIFDGYLDVFVAQATVIPCQEYTIKLVIADVSDSNYDSAVFLEAKSFGTSSLKVERITQSLDGTVAEGCSNAVIRVEFPSILDKDTSIVYSLLGQSGTNSAILNEDFNVSSNMLHIPAGSRTAELSLEILEDDIEEELETLYIAIETDVCSSDTIEIFFRDNLINDIVLPDDIILCDSTSIFIRPEIPGDLISMPNLIFTNKEELEIEVADSAYSSEIVVDKVVPDILSEGMIARICIDSIEHRWLDDLDLYVIAPGGQVLELSTDNGRDGGNGILPDQFIRTCFTTGALENINLGNPIAGNLDLSNIHYTGDYLPEGIWEDLWPGNTPVNGLWKLLLIDDVDDNLKGKLFSWSIEFNSPYEFSLEWNSNTAMIDCKECPETWVTPLDSSSLVFVAKDSYGCESRDTVIVEQGEKIPIPGQFSCEVTEKINIHWEWDSVQNALDYEVRFVGDSNWISTSSLNQIAYTNLDFDREYILELRAVGLECQSKIVETSCRTEICAKPEIEKISIVNTTSSCIDDGEIVIDAQGQGPFTYSIDGITSDTGYFSGLSGGDYILIIADTIGCTILSTINIEQSDEFHLEILVDKAISCSDASDAILRTKISGGSPPYRYEWSDGSSDSILTNADGGVYEITVTDQQDCSEQGLILIEEPALLRIDNIDLFNPLCPQEENGSVSYVVSGGVAPYNYRWSDDPERNNSMAGNLKAGSYSITVDDANACTLTDQFTLENPAPLEFNAVINNERCEDEMNGSISLLPSGGTAVLQLNWENGDSSRERNNLTNGDYCVSLTDMNGCSIDTCFIVVEAIGISISDSVTHVSCGDGANGSIFIDISGGVAPFEFLWVSEGFISQEKDIQNLLPGSYMLQLTDANGCIQAGEFQVDSTSVIDVSLEIVNPMCFNEPTGSVFTMVTGGIPPYSYSWIGPGDFMTDQPNLTAVFAGNYLLEVTDSLGCEARFDIQLSQASEALILNITDNDTICHNSNTGYLEAGISGGTPPYDFSWSNEETGTSIQNLVPGMYELTITDSNNCTISAEREVYALEPISVEIVTGLADCSGSATGSAEIIEIKYGNVPSELSGFTIQWNTNPPQTGIMATGLVGGNNYTVEVADRFGCKIESIVTIENPVEIFVELLELQSVRCFGADDGQITVQALGGLGPYEFEWSPNVMESNENKAFGLRSGKYSVTITDRNGCNASNEFEIEEAFPLSVELTAIPVTCKGESDGKIVGVAYGESAPYQFKWNVNAEGSNLENLTSGIYTLTLTDSKGCEVTQDIEVHEPAELIDFTYQVFHPSCEGIGNGYILVEATGGNGDYVYSTDGEKFTGSPELVGLTSGIYTVYLKDKKGCLTVKEDILLNETETFSVDIGPDIEVSFGQQVTFDAMVINGLPAFVYEWSSTPVVELNCTQCEQTAINSATESFILTLEVIDASDCFAVASKKVLVEIIDYINVPTGFTPDGNRVNDELNVFGRNGIFINEFKIYSRWGQLVYEAFNFEINDITIGWDGSIGGSEMPPNTYIWTIQAVLNDGSIEKFQGNTMLIR